LKVLQIIDTLRPGGAEMMAVTLANVLSERGISSHLLLTRSNGSLCELLNSKVNIELFDRKWYIDLWQIFQITSYLKKNQIDIIHAHTLSWKLSFLLSFFVSQKIIWHDHQGDRLQVNNWLLNLALKRFDGIIAVNPDLAKWAGNKLGHKQVLYLLNFIAAQDIEAHAKITTLQAPGTFKIICVANLRPQKDHQNLILAYERLQKMLQSQQEIALVSSEKSNPKNKASKLSLHLIGAESDADYVAKLKKTISGLGLDQIYFYGGQQNPRAMMAQADLGVLSSLSEGLPMTLLEYAQAEIPVVVTDVGACAEVVAEHGLVVPPQNPEALAQAMLQLIQNSEHTKKMAIGLKSRVESHYSSRTVVPKLIEFYKGMSE
jgi:glycosyltransferase involved in cell wall biosynthesis